jgi:hypothetical protein
MGQTICGGVREGHQETLNMEVFKKSNVYCVKRNSPYYKKRIRKAEKRVANAKAMYDGYKEKKMQRKYRNRSNSN